MRDYDNVALQFNETNRWVAFAPSFKPACLRRGRQACLPNLMACRSRQVLNVESLVSGKGNSSFHVFFKDPERGPI